jgi:putative membrane protein
MGSQGMGNRSGDEPAPADQQFMEETAMDNRAELELSRLAAQKASSPAVKQFAQQMMRDHQTATGQLSKIAQQKDMKLPTDVPEPSERLQDRLQDVSGKEFDMMYMKHMATAHTKDLSSFRMYSQTGQDAELRNFATTQIPTLQHHMQQAQSILSQMGVNTSQSSAMR